MRAVVLDTETTGLDPKRDRLVEIGCVEIIDLLPTGRTWHHYLNPGIPVPQEAVDVHGLTSEFLADKPSFSAVAGSLLEFLGDADIIAHNAPFDIGFLAAAFGAPPPNKVVDSLALARSKFPGSPCTLDALCRRFGVDLSRRQHHSALLDAQLLAEVYADLVGRQRALVLDANQNAGGISVLEVRQRPRPLTPRLTAAELHAHAAMVEQIKGAIWRQQND